MAISYVQTSVGTGTSSASVSAPTGIATDDVMVVFKADRATSGSTTPPTGWTRVASVAGTSGRFEVFWGVYGRNGIGSGPWSFSGTTRTLARCVAYRGCDPTTPMDVAPSARYNASGTTGTTSITPVTNNNWVLAGFASLTSNYTWTNEAVATSPTLTERIESAYSTYLDIAVADGTQSSAGATGASSGTMSTNGNNAGALVALRPSPALLAATPLCEISTASGDLTNIQNGFRFATLGAELGSYDTSAQMGTDEAWGQKFVAPGSGDLDVLEIGCFISVTDASLMKFSIWTHDAVNDCPESMVANSESGELTLAAGNGKRYFTYTTKPRITGGTTYWIVPYNDYASTSIKVDHVNATGIRTADEYPTSGGYPVWPTGTEWHTSDFSVTDADLTYYAVVKVPSTVHSDDFNRANSSDLGANWTANSDGSIGITSNQAKGRLGSGVRNGNIRTAETYAGDHWSEVEWVSNPPSGDWVSPCVRMQSAANTYAYYALLYNSSGTMQAAIWRVDNTNGWTNLSGYTNITPAAGDKFRLEANGDVLTLYQNGTSIRTYTDSSAYKLTGGDPGVAVTGAALFDNWKGADYGTEEGGTQALLQAAVSCAVTIAAALTSVITAAASVACACTVAAALTTTKPIAANVSCAATTSGAITTQITARATPVCAVTTAAQLTTSIPMAASAAGACTTSAALTTSIPLAAGASCACTTYADLSVGASPNIYANVTCAAQAQGALSTEIRAQGAATGAVTTSAALTTVKPIQAAVSCSCTTSASLTTEIRMAGAVSGAATTSAGLSTSILMAGAATGTAQATGVLTTQIRLAATPQLAVTTFADLTVPGQSALLAATPLCQCTTSAALTTEKPLSASVSGTAAAQGSLTTQILLAGAASGTVDVYADLLVGQPSTIMYLEVSHAMTSRLKVALVRETDVSAQEGEPSLAVRMSMPSMTVETRSPGLHVEVL